MKESIVKSLVKIGYTEKVAEEIYDNYEEANALSSLYGYICAKEYEMGVRDW